MHLTGALRGIELDRSKPGGHNTLLWDCSAMPAAMGKTYIPQSGGLANVSIRYHVESRGSYGAREKNEQCFISTSTPETVLCG